MMWHPDSGLFAYTSGCIIVLEDLQTGTQRHLMGELSNKLEHLFMVHVRIALTGYVGLI